MRKSIQIIGVTAGTVLAAAAVFLALAAPGFLSDASSTVPVTVAEASR